MTFVTTSVYAALLGIIFLVLRTIVVIERAKTGISIQTNNNMDLAVKVRIFGNFIETVPLLLILMVLAESAGASTWILHLTGGALLISRLLHPFGLDPKTPKHPLRILSGILTMLSALTAIGFIFWHMVS